MALEQFELLVGGGDARRHMIEAADLQSSGLAAVRLAAARLTVFTLSAPAISLQRRPQRSSNRKNLLSFFDEKKLRL